MSQRVIASHVGLTRDQLNRIESRQVAPRFGPAWEFCAFLDLNPLWLAFGDANGRSAFVDADHSDIPDSDSFLRVMRSTELDGYGDYRETVLQTSTRPTTLSNIAADANLDADSFLRRMSELGKKWQSQVPTEELSQFLRYVAAAADQYARKKIVAIPAIKQYLIANSMWKHLRQRLREATQKPGTKKAVAKHLGVSPAAVSQWLSGAAAPTAETTLRLLAWVAVAEAKQKSAPEVRSTRPAQKTRKRKSKHEKPSPDRKKR
jgi:transcriptional regulator with XRE-family HTH domain